jgi:hypothetical protein
MGKTLTAWTKPEDYAGYNPEGHFGVLAIHRDSKLLDRVNWDVARERLAAAAGLPAVPELAGSDPDTTPRIYTWEAGHWAVGWVRYLMVRPDAGDGVLEAAKGIVGDLSDHPALDEDRWSEQELEGASAYWKGLSVRDRADLLRYVRERGEAVSLFAARRDWVPDNDGYLDDLLREGL